MMHVRDPFSIHPMKTYALLPALMLLAACWPLVPGDNAGTNNTMTGSDTESMMIEDNDPSNDDDDMIPGASTGANGRSSAPAPAIHSANYRTFSADVLTDGRPKVLFFHAAWCPICRAADEELSGWYGEQRPTIDTYKVDYDTQTDLKARYGVTYQHTFVLVDGEGNAIQTLQGPSDAALQALIGA